MAEFAAQPFKIDRTKLVERLKERLGEEEEARAAAQKASKKIREGAEEAVASLSKDELLNLVIKYTGFASDEIVEMVDEAKKSGRLKSPEIQPSNTESSLKKWVRVLEMSNDNEIEVKPTDGLYPLL